MKRPRFLFDEHVDHNLARALRKKHDEMDILCVGDSNGPPKSTPDEELLKFVEAERRILVTLDKKTMPGHLERHFRLGGHTWGVLILRSGFSVGDYAAELSLVWQASEADEWFDGTEYLPY